MDFDQILLRDVLEEISNLQDIDYLAVLLQNLRMLLGVANLAFHGLFVPGRVSSDRLIAVTYPKDWIERYVSRNYFRIDPVEIATRGGTEPLDWKIG